LWLYESLHRHGTMLSPETMDLEHIYRAAGLERVGAELPDHASIELTFLAYSAERQMVDRERASDWRLVERRFIQKHAGRWLPELGRSLAETGDLVYGPVGMLLWRWISEASRPAARNKSTTLRQKPLPHLKLRDACTLCGFCVQVCPVRALAIHETDGETRLLLNPAACLGCRKCVPICESGALSIIERPSAGRESARGWTLLRASSRAQCPACRRPTVSRAEYE
jgi:ferredoxin